MSRFLVLYDRPNDPESFNRHYGDVPIPLAKTRPGLRCDTTSRPVTAMRGGEPYEGRLWYWNGKQVEALRWCASAGSQP